MAAALADPATAPAGTTLVTETADTGAVKATPALDRLVGRNAQTFKLALASTGQVIAVDTGVLEPFATDALTAAVPEGAVLFPESIRTTVGSPTVDGGVVSFDIGATGQAWRPLDEAALLAAGARPLGARGGGCARRVRRGGRRGLAVLRGHHPGRRPCDADGHPADAERPVRLLGIDLGDRRIGLAAGATEIRGRPRPDDHPAVDRARRTGLAFGRSSTSRASRASSSACLAIPMAPKARRRRRRGPGRRSSWSRWASPSCCGTSATPRRTRRPILGALRAGTPVGLPQRRLASVVAGRSTARLPD